MNSREIREKFIRYFEGYKHQKWESASLIPANDPTLLFVNAGMVPFKNYFIGAAKSENPRAVSVQKCVRAGGKHNDLENVGFTARHHTFFEMMGNFSFGDYFKKEAISLAWRFLTEELKISKDKLYVTAHHSDQEAADIWLKDMGVAKERFYFRGDKDNFWEMGDVGPCGPCSEIFYDHGAEFSDPSADTSQCLLDDESRYVEIWNLVFMQFERFQEEGQIKQKPLPNPSIDTGAGLERLAAVLQGEYNNFDTDVFSPIMMELEKVSGLNYQTEKTFKTNFRVVADHVRSSTLLITDGVLPSNEGRGYVLRRIIRRAVRFIDQMGVKEPALYKMVNSVFSSFHGAYKENEKNKTMAEKYLKIEEENFRRTLSSGLNLLENEIQQMKEKKEKTLPGQVMFKLYDTHGIPADLTELILKEKGFQADWKNFEQEMEKQKTRSRKASGFSVQEDQLRPFFKIKEQFGETVFTGYQETQGESELQSLIALGKENWGAVFKVSPFYAESGGQSGDQGQILNSQGQVMAQVVDTLKPVPGLHVHKLNGKGALTEGENYSLSVNVERRRLIEKNHTATHLLHSALRKVLGDHVKQAGSFVGPQRLRFDFSHPEAMKKSELKQVESLVNEQIFLGTSAQPKEMSKDQALEEGAMALFGEKYGDQVRVLKIGDFSVELCGGTHVSNTGEIGLFHILSESSLSSGVRRIEAVTHLEALNFVNQKLNYLNQAEKVLSVGGADLEKRLEQLTTSLKEKDREIKSLKEKLQSSQADELFDSLEELPSGMVFQALTVDASTDLRQFGDLFISKNKKGILLLMAPKGDKASVLLKTFKGNGQLNCSQALKDVLAVHGGRGGGKPEMAQGSVDSQLLKNVEKDIRTVLESL